MIVIDGGKLPAVGLGLPHVLHLGGQRSYSGFVQNRQFGGGRPGVESASTSHIAHVYVGDVRDSVVIHIVNDSGVHVVDRAVVSKLVMIPIPALIAAADITVAVIDAAVVANVMTPIPVVPAIATVVISPVGRGPKRTHKRRNYPCAGYPIIAGGRVRPVPRGPNVILARTFGLTVFRQRWRSLLSFHGGFGGIVVVGVVVVVLPVILIGGS
jgi:hypothetical protein